MRTAALFARVSCDRHHEADQSRIGRRPRPIRQGKEISDQVVTWFKSNRELKEEEFTARKGSLDESAKRIVGELPAMTVISHWLDYEVATLLSNPQLPGAIDNTLFARAQRK